MSDLFVVTSDNFTLEVGSNVRRPVGHDMLIAKGSIVEYDSTASNGNVWFYTKDREVRGKIQAGALANVRGIAEVTE